MLPYWRILTRPRAAVLSLRGRKRGLRQSNRGSAGQMPMVRRYGHLGWLVTDWVQARAVLHDDRFSNRRQVCRGETLGRTRCERRSPCARRNGDGSHDHTVAHDDPSVTRPPQSCCCAVASQLHCSTTRLVNPRRALLADCYQRLRPSQQRLSGPKCAATPPRNFWPDGHRRAVRPPTHPQQPKPGSRPGSETSRATGPTWNRSATPPSCAPNSTESSCSTTQSVCTPASGT